MSLTNLTDEQLMARFQRSLDEEAFRELAERYYDRAEYIAGQRLGPSYAGCDAVQEALLRVVRYRKRYNPEQAFAPWFNTILRHVCTDMLRKDIRRRNLLEKFAEHVRHALPKAPSGGKLRDLLGGLSAADAEFLNLRYGWGYSMRELTDHLGCSLEAAKKRHQRILGRLRRRLE